MSLEEMAGVVVDDDPTIVYESDIDWVADQEDGDAAEREADWELANCCGGRDWTCGHYGHGVMSMKDYRDKYDIWEEP